MTFFASCIMAWRLWFTRGLLKKAKSWHAKALLAEMNRLDKIEQRARKAYKLAKIEVSGAEQEYDGRWKELHEEGLAK